MTDVSDHVPWLDRLDFLEAAVVSRLKHSHRDRTLMSFAADVETIYSDIRQCLDLLGHTDNNFTAPSAEQARLLWWGRLRARTIGRLRKILEAYRELVRSHRIVEFIPDPPLPELQPRVRPVGTQLHHLDEADAELQTYAKHNRPVTAAEVQREVDHILGRDKPEYRRRVAQQARELKQLKLRMGKGPPPDVAQGATPETDG